MDEVIGSSDDKIKRVGVGEADDKGHEDAIVVKETGQFRREWKN